MGSDWRHAFRVWFADGTYRDVYGQEPERAKKFAAGIQRMIGYRKEGCRPTRVEDLGHRGTDAAYCPRCGGQQKLFEATSAEGIDTTAITPPARG